MAESLSDPLPIVLVPGLLATARLYAEQIPELWRFGPVTVAMHTRDDSISAIARRILSAAPPKFALAGLSMGGYIAFEVMRQAPARVARLALLDTSARPDAPEQTEQRRAQIELARRGRLAEVSEVLFPRLVHAARRDDEILRRTVRLMTEEVGPDAFVRQQTAIMGRGDSRPGLAAIRCPTLVIVGDGDQLTPPERAAEISDGIPGAQLVTVPGSGHLSTLEQPRAVTQALTTFLAE
jgi:pimeloyl-ACP methyl ester carboxylesterase